MKTEEWNRLKEKAKRHVFLYCLGVKVPHPYNMLISKMSKFLDIENIKKENFVNYLNYPTTNYHTKDGQYLYTIMKIELANGYHRIELRPGTELKLSMRETKEFAKEIKHEYPYIMEYSEILAEVILKKNGMVFDMFV